MQEKVKITLEQNQNERLEATMDHDVLDNSSMMNLSAFVADGAQKDKLRQVELIG
jgi:arginase family enzyme